MPFCTNCGKKFSEGAKFCGSCGTPQVTGPNTCRNCGKTLEETEKFCSGCGNPIVAAPEPKAQAEPKQKPKEEKFTEEGKKIITGVPKPEQNQPVPPPPSSMAPSPQKRKRGCRGCFISFIIVLIAVLFLVAGGVFVLNKLTNGEIVDKFKEGYNKESSEQVEQETNATLNESTPSENKAPKPLKANESKSVKQIASTVEKIFEKADTTQLKNLLTPNGLKAYGGEFKKIEPYMVKYAQAFKNRKLISSDKNFALYSFKDDEGNEFTVEFALSDGGSWKLVRF